MDYPTKTHFPFPHVVGLILIFSEQKFLYSVFIKSIKRKIKREREIVREREREIDRIFYNASIELTTLYLIIILTFY